MKAGIIFLLGLSLSHYFELAHADETAAGRELSWKRLRQGKVSTVTSETQAESPEHEMLSPNSRQTQLEDGILQLIMSLPSSILQALWALVVQVFSFLGIEVPPGRLPPIPTPPPATISPSPVTDMPTLSPSASPSPPPAMLDDGMSMSMSMRLLEKDFFF